MDRMERQQRTVADANRICGMRCSGNAKLGHNGQYLTSVWVSFTNQKVWAGLPPPHLSSGHNCNTFILIMVDGFTPPSLTEVDDEEDGVSVANGRSRNLSHLIDDDDD